jgi:integral membrane protein
MSSAILWLRFFSFIDAVSLLVLLGIAMPLKYLADRPEAVSVVGMIHGVLWLLLIVAAAWAWARGLSSKLTLAVLGLSVVPTGPFWIDPALRRAQRAAGGPG